MQCGISGEVPTRPVVTPKGILYEKHLIEAHLEANGHCPVSNEPLAKEQLIELKIGNTPKPRPVAVHSIPALLQAQQTEWDALVLENFELKKQLDIVRQELSHSLYRYDASCRVVARLMKEKEELQQLVSAQDIPTKTPIPSSITKEIKEVAERLFKGRKNTKTAAPISPESIQKFTEKSSVAPHSTTAPGVLCLAHRDGISLSGGADGVGVLFNHSSGKIEAKLQGHSKAINVVRFDERKRNVVYTASEDRSCKIWLENQESKYDCVSTLQDHMGSVKGVSLHPSGNYLSTCGLDGSWVFYDVSGGVEPKKILKNDNAKGALYSCGFHPDGRLLATGLDGQSDSAVQIWDMLTGKVTGALGDKLKIKTLCLSFSENGYHLATGHDNGVVKIWDLRKDKNEEIIFQENDPVRPTPVNDVQYDTSGKYLATCTDAVRIYAKDRKQLVALTDHTASVTCCAWGAESQSLFSGSLDRQIKLFNAE